MIRALALKELREIWPIALLGLAVLLAGVASLVGFTIFLLIPGMPDATDGIPFVGDDFVWFHIPVVGVLAIALALRQTLGESVFGTYLFLLHRPLNRRAIITVKIGVGIATLTICSSIPIVLYGAWAATPGTHPSPFEWSMTTDAWWVCLAMPLVYLGAFTCGLRPASWFGTRLLPLAAGAFATLALIVDFQSWIAVLVLVVAYVIMPLSVLHTAQVRDYP